MRRFRLELLMFVPLVIGLLLAVAYAQTVPTGTNSGGGGGVVNGQITAPSTVQFTVGGVNQLDYGITAAGNWTSPTGSFAVAKAGQVGFLFSSTLTAGRPQYGLSYEDANNLIISANPAAGGFGSVAIKAGSAGTYGLVSTVGIGFNATNSNPATPGNVDIALQRTGAGVVEIDSGAIGTFRDLSLRHIRGNGAPTANTCTGFALATGSSDLAGQVTLTSGTTCSVTFSVTFTNAPFCVITPVTALSTTQIATTTGGFTATFGTAQTAFQYVCMGT